MKTAKTNVISKRLLGLSSFIGLGAYWGGLMMFISPDGSLWGMDPILPHMQCLPFAEKLFHNFIFSGIMLIAVNGICNTIAVIGLLRHRLYGAICGLLSGIMLFLWLSVQWIIFDMNPLTTVYTLLSIVQIWLSLLILRKYKNQTC